MVGRRISRELVNVPRVEFDDRLRFRISDGAEIFVLVHQFTVGGVGEIGVFHDDGRYTEFGCPGVDAEIVAGLFEMRSGGHIPLILGVPVVNAEGVAGVGAGFDPAAGQCNGIADGIENFSGECVGTERFDFRDDGKAAVYAGNIDAVAVETDEDVGIVLESNKRTGKELQIGIILTGEDDFEIPVIAQSFGNVLRHDEIILFFGTDTDIGTAVVSAVTGIEDDDDFFVCGRNRQCKRKAKDSHYNKGRNSAQNRGERYHWTSPKVL